MSPTPSAVPSTCGHERRTPNAAPDAHSRTLLGPGVTVHTNPNPSSATSRSMAGP